MIPAPLEVRSKRGIYVLTAENCAVCVFPETFKKFEHVFLSLPTGEHIYFFDPKLVKKTRTEGFPLYWRPYPTEADRKAYRQRSLSTRELIEFVAQLEKGVDWIELDDSLELE